jgi:predicted esterase
VAVDAGLTAARARGRIRPPKGNHVAPVEHDLLARSLQERAIAARTHGRYLVSPPAEGSGLGLIVGCHGYGENAERHAVELRRIPGSEHWTLVAVQALHRFYNSRSREVIASWMTRQHREAMIADNIAYLDAVVSEVLREAGAGTRLVFVGFSQGVGMAFRAAVRGMHRAAGVVALGGDIPPDVRPEPGERFPQALLGRGARDEWYTAEKLQADVDLLQVKGVSVRALTFDGGHEWTDEFREAAGRFLAAMG